jgi:hypothetical protein
MRKSDPHYAALLVEEARLHLGTVMAGQDSEPFFSAMLQIIEDKIYLGYTDLRNKEVKLKGIKDFLQSVYFGLGIKDMEGFLCNVVKASLKERSRNKYAHAFIQWLRQQDAAFQFPQSYFEYRRVLRMIYYTKNMSKQRKLLSYRTARFLYNLTPEIIEHIGPGRKYKSVEACYYGEGHAEKKKSFKSLKSYKTPTIHQLEGVADDLFARFGIFKSKQLASMLLERCERETEARAGDREPDDDPVAAGAGWDIELGDAAA